MWKDDDDRIELIIDDIMKRSITDIPLICPICEEKQLHFYIFKWNDKSFRGGLWTWCSHCRNFSHGTIKVPQWWKNCDDIPIENLNSVPDYLETNKEKIDDYVIKLL